MDFEERAHLRARKVGSQIYMTVTLWEVVDRFAESRHLGSGAAVEHLLRQGLRREAELASQSKEAKS